MRNIDVVCVGEALVDLLPDRRGALEEVETFRRSIGGAPANVAVGLARLATRVGFIGLVGDDPFGRFLTRALSLEGIDTSAICHTKHGKTGLTFISLSEAGERSFFSYRDPAADILLALEHVESANPMLQRAKVVHIGSSSLSKDPARTATWRAVALAKEHGCLLSCDPNLRLHIWHDKAEAIQMTHRLIGQADILKISDDEAEVLFGTRDPERAAALVHSAGPTVVTVTLGANGAYLSSPTFKGASPARAVQVVDTTGAGDGFCAGLLSVIAPQLGDDLRLASLPAETLLLALQRGNRVGGAVVAALGATPGLPRLSELL